MLEIIALLVVVGIAGVLITAAFGPNAFRVQRSTRIAAVPEKIHPLINQLSAFNSWSPFAKVDPAMTGRYAGPDAGPGATYSFKGGAKVGEGSIEILESRPTLVTMRLTMVKPMAARNLVTFSLKPEGAATEVSWTMEGQCSYVAKIFNLFMSCDKMCGGAFETGLASLKTLAEGGVRQKAA